MKTAKNIKQSKSECLDNKDPVVKGGGRGLQTSISIPRSFRARCFTCTAKKLRHLLSEVTHKNKLADCNDCIVYLTLLCDITKRVSRMLANVTRLPCIQMQHHFFDDILSDNRADRLPFRRKKARTQVKIEDRTRGEDRNRSKGEKFTLLIYLVYIFLQPSGSLDQEGQEEQDKNNDQTL